MQCVTDLVKLRDSIHSRVRRLRLILSGISAPIGTEDRRALSFVTIELDNMVIVGLRQYTKSSLLRSRTAAGDRITAAVRPASTEEAAAFISQSINPRGYSKMGSPASISEKKEIPFRDPKNTEKVLIDYAVSNLPNFALALSLNAEIFYEIKIYRHFFAHRSGNTYNEVQSFSSKLGVVGEDMPEHLILRGRPGTGVRFVDGWLADVENFFDLAT